MKRLAAAILWAFAVAGILSMTATLDSYLKKHYSISCVENNADDYGFAVPQIKAGLTNSTAVYGEHL